MSTAQGHLGLLFFSTSWTSLFPYFLVAPGIVLASVVFLFGSPFRPDEVNRQPIPFPRVSAATTPPSLYSTYTAPTSSSSLWHLCSW